MAGRHPCRRRVDVLPALLLGPVAQYFAMKAYLLFDDGFGGRLSRNRKMEAKSEIRESAASRPPARKQRARTAYDSRLFRQAVVDSLKNSIPAPKFAIR